MHKIRHYYPGGNTADGYISFFGEILKKDTVGRIAVIKGGPGTGKSTFMKKIGGRLEGSGEMVDYLHCSSDTNSLDGIYLPKYNTAMLDGTYPHVFEARYPASSDIILNFGEFINENELKKYAAEIKNLNSEIGYKFNEAYKYLGAAKKISEVMEYKSGANLDGREISNTAYNISKRVVDYSNSGSMKDFSYWICGGESPSGAKKKFFLSAVTPTGTKNYMDYDFLDRYVIKLDCQTGDCGYKILNQIISFCQNGNIDTEAYYCPLKPNCPEHIIFPSANVAVTVGNSYHNYAYPDEVIYYNDFIKGSYDNGKEQVIYANLIELAIASLGDAGKLRHGLEKFYSDNFDFAKLKEFEERTVDFLTNK
jgi:hypothetical protein